MNNLGIDSKQYVYFFLNCLIFAQFIFIASQLFTNVLRSQKQNNVEGKRSQYHDFTVLIRNKHDS